MNPTTIVWIYIVLLLFGGVMGLIKGKSKVSLIMAVIFAVLLSLYATGLFSFPYMPEILLAVLAVVFSMRLFKTKKFVPSGLMLSVTALALLALFAVKRM